MERKLTIQREKDRVTKLIYGVVGSWGLLAILFGLIDLQISQFLVDTQSEWAYWIADYGEVPGKCLVVGSLLLLDRLRDASGAKRDFFISLLILSGLTLFIFWLGDPHFEKSASIQWLGGYLIPIIGMIVLFLQILLKRVDISYFRNLKRFTLITVSLAIINPLLFVQITKFLWGRVRFRDLSPDYSNYTPWYLPQGITGHNSFPSGHAAMGWMLLPLLLLTRDKSRKVKLIVGSAILGWGVLVALGRIVIGAHYASDILFPTGIALVWYLLLYRHYYCKRAAI